MCVCVCVWLMPHPCSLPALCPTSSLQSQVLLFARIALPTTIHRGHIEGHAPYQEQDDITGGSGGLVASSKAVRPSVVAASTCTCGGG